MAQTIEREKQRVRKEISEFGMLEKKIAEKRYKAPHLRDFKELITHCKKALEKDVYVSLLRIVKGYPPAEQSGRLAEFRFNLKHFRQLMLNFLLSSSDIPRELYFLSDLFLEYNKCNAKYLICVSEEIATLPLSYILRQLGLDEVCPIFWNSIKNREFYFVQVTPGLKSTKSSEDWPIMLHEFAHIICCEQKIEDRYFPAVSVYDALQVMELLYTRRLPPNAPLVETSTKKLYAAEYLADFLVTRCFGATFGWRFVEEYVDLRDIFEPDRTHPPPDRRLEKIASEVGTELNMPDFSELLRSKIEIMIGEFKSLVDERIIQLDVDAILKDVDSALKNVLKEIRKRYEYSLTPEKIRENIRESQWFQVLSKMQDRRKIETQIDKHRLPNFLKELGRNFRKGTPIIVDPPTLYFIFMSEFATPTTSKRVLASKREIERRELLNELIADSIRLFAVQRLFSS